MYILHALMAAASFVSKAKSTEMGYKLFMAAHAYIVGRHLKLALWTGTGGLTKAKAVHLLAHPPRSGWTATTISLQNLDCVLRPHLISLTAILVTVHHMTVHHMTVHHETTSGADPGTILNG